MKQYMQLLAAAILPAVFSMTAVAQNKSEGRISYKITMNMREGEIQGSDEIRDMLPEKIDRYSLFTFKNRKAKISEDESAAPEPTGGAVIKVSFNDSEKPAYIDMDRRLTQRLFTENDKNYLVNDAAPGKDAQQPQGNIINMENVTETGKTKKILGYTCKELLMNNGGKNASVWYTTELPILGSPLGLMTDKGLVMEMESSFLSFRASHISFEKVADDDVLPPAGSVSLTKAEFDKIKQQ